MLNDYHKDQANRDWRASPHPQGQRPTPYGQPMPRAPETRAEGMPGAAPRGPAAYAPHHAAHPMQQQPMPSADRRAQPSATMECQNLPLAMAWFADQKFGSIYDPETAMERGTLFPELDKPWLAPQRRPAR